jgi:uncharacterized membrane protein YkoI
MDIPTNKNRKMMVMAGVVAAVLATAAIFAMQPALAQGTNSTQSGQATTPTTPSIKGSVSIQNATNAFVHDNVKVPLATALSTAQSQVSGGTVTGGQLTVVQGYLVYQFKVANYDAGTYRVVLVDAGNGSVLYTSQDMTLHNGGLGGFGCGGRHFGHNWNWGSKMSPSSGSSDSSTDATNA